MLHPIHVWPHWPLWPPHPKVYRFMYRVYIHVWPHWPLWPLAHGYMKPGGDLHLWDYFYQFIFSFHDCRVIYSLCTHHESYYFKSIFVLNMQKYNKRVFIVGLYRHVTETLINQKTNGYTSKKIQYHGYLYVVSWQWDPEVFTCRIAPLHSDIRKFNI